MKRIILALVGILSLNTVWANSSLPKAAKEVTLLIYYSGDNNLSQFMKSSLDRVLAEGTSSNLHVAVQYDGLKKNDSLRLSVNQEKSKLKAEVLAQNLEYDMGKAQTLADFLKWGLQNFPSKKLILVVSAHGRGVLNVPVNDGSSFTESSEIIKLASSSDDTSKNYMNEQTLVSGMKKVLGSRKLDLLIYNSCLMGNLEVMTMFSSIANFAIGSEYPIYVTLKDSADATGRAIAIENIIKNLKQMPFNARIIAMKMIQNFKETYQDFQFPGGDPDIAQAETFPSTLAFYDLGAIESLSREFSKMLVDFKIASQKDPKILDRFFEENISSPYVDSLGYIDLLIFYRSLARSLDLKSAKEKMIQFENLHRLVVLEKIALHVDSQEELGHLSFFFPSLTKEASFVRRFQNYYSQIEIPVQFGWVSFLDYFWQEVDLKSDAFWLSLVQRWDAGEVIYADSKKSAELADYFFFLHLDVVAIKLASDKDLKKLENYAKVLFLLKRSSPELESHKAYVKSLLNKHK